MSNQPNDKSPKSTLSSRSLMSTSTIRRSLTPEKLAQSNCSQCYLLRAKIQSMDQSSIFSTSSQHSSRSQTPDSVNCSDHRSLSSTPTIPYHNHSIAGKLPRDSSPSAWLYRRRDRRTGRIMMPNIKQTMTNTKENPSKTSSIPLSRNKKSLIHPGEYLFEEDLDSTIETEIDDLDSTILLSTLTKNDQSSSKQKSKTEEYISVVEKQLTAIQIWLDNHHVTRQMMILLKKPEFLFSFYFIECFILSFLWFNRIQPKEFIDEQFHRGQTLSYCQGNFTKVKIPLLK